jgi:hypothetical protein
MRAGGQTCTCIGNWHYDRGLYERHGYKPAKLVIQRLADIVSKTGNLLLGIPVRGDGSIDEAEIAILDGLERWFGGGRDRAGAADRLTLSRMVQPPHRGRPPRPFRTRVALAAAEIVILNCCASEMLS